MADEVSASRTNGNGERLEVRIGNRSIGISSRDLILVVFVAGVFVISYLSHQSTREMLGRLYLQQTQFADTQHRGIEDVKAFLHASQNELAALLRANNEALRAMLREQNARMDQHTDALSTQMQIHEWNQAHPAGEQLPLTLPPSLFQKRLEQER